MNRLCMLCSTLILLLVCAFTLTAQPTAVITVKGYSPQELIDNGMDTPRSTSLDVVGVNQMVYLNGNDGMTAYAWSLVSAPAGAVAALSATDVQEVTLVPDVVGQYKVSLTVTDANGTSDPVELTITAAKFVGVGSMDGLSVNTGNGQCAQCHSTAFGQWKDTQHATALQSQLDAYPGEGNSHFGESCNECHTTGFDEHASGNDGFDDIQADLGWIFPETLQAGNWDDMKTNFEPLAQRANVQCEACHGPGSLHFGAKDKIDMSIAENTCAFCHDEVSHHPHRVQWANSRHSIGYASGATRSGCNVCHSGWGFIKRIDTITDKTDNRPDMGEPRVTCAVCHDPHSTANETHIRTLADVTLGDGTTVVSFGGKGKVCMQCHVGRRNAEEYASDPANISSHFGPHYSAQADMLAGANAIEYGVPISATGHKLAAKDACITCHMFETPATGEAGHNLVGGHTFAVTYDNGTPDDPSDDVDNVTACVACHGDITSFDDVLATADFDNDGEIESATHEVEGLLHNLGMLLPPVGEPEVVFTKDDYDWTGLEGEEAAHRQALLKAGFNHAFVEEDGSGGIHNVAYSVALLRRSIASLTTGDIGAGMIISITDVPNDQGRQVRVAWSKFVTDGFSANPLQSYSVYRMVEEAAAGKAERVDSFDQMLAQSNAGNVGTKFRVAEGETWDFVAWLPAAGHETYSIVVPTLHDQTTSSDGMSTFKIAGTNGVQHFETEPASGYSVDNLVPMAPANASVQITDGGVLLQWDESEDADFNYFAVYRAEESGFAPTEDNMIATLTGMSYTDANVVTGSKYYYRVAAFDFSENQGEMTAELTASITGVAAEVALPTEFALMNNYPNPFNPETTIEYQLPEQGHVLLRVYSMLGTEVRTLVQGSKAAGSYSVVWDGRDNNGSVVPSGMYMYRIESGSFNAVKKMVMMK
ncbi:T9SS type A sorting domain-containing protein [candidate division KSB1 bacterium]|nr:T9SS type A sorting domain-containing protein [candidate division KSB1 bacterium]